MYNHTHVVPIATTTKEIQVYKFMSQTWEFSPIQLPKGLAGHCQINLDGGNIFIYGGVSILDTETINSFYHYEEESYIFVASNSSWIKVYFDYRVSLEKRTFFEGSIFFDKKNFCC